MSGEKKPFIQVEHKGHMIEIVNRFSKCSLVVDGKEQSSYSGAVAWPFTLYGKAGANRITAEFKLKWYGGMMYVYYNNTLIAKRYHL